MSEQLLVATSLQRPAQLSAVLLPLPGSLGPYGSTGGSKHQNIQCCEKKVWVLQHPYHLYFSTEMKLGTGQSSKNRD